MFTRNRVFIVLIMVAATMIIASAAYGQVGGITYNIEGLTQSPDGLVCIGGNTITYNLYYYTWMSDHYNVSNAFRIYSPDGATWTDSADGNYHPANFGPIGVDTTSEFPFTMFDVSTTFRTHSSPAARADGISPDTIVFIGQASAPPHGFGGGSKRAFSFHIKTNVADSGKTICFDSVIHFPPSQTWKWSIVGYPAIQPIPAWYSQPCVKIAAPKVPGNYPDGISIAQIEGADNTAQGYTARAGNLLKFRIAYANNSDSGYNISNGFKITSPDGATWTDSAKSGNFHGANLGPFGIDTTGYLSRSQFPTVFTLRSFVDLTNSTSADGISPDVVAFDGAGAAEGQGLPPQFNGLVYNIYIQTKASDTGKTICIDSTTHYKCCATWRWAVLYGGPAGGYVDPAWSGQVCIKLINPDALITPLMQTCPESLPGQHCGTGNFTYHATKPGGAPMDVRYYLYSGPGTIDSMTGVWTGTDLTPGTYDVAVNARNAISELRSITCWGTASVPNQPPAFPGAMLTTPATVGEVNHYTPTVTNDCDALSFTLVDNAGVEGPVSINPSTGQLTYTPTTGDSSRAEPVAMKVAASDSFAADTVIILWRFMPGCLGTVGNVDCDATEGVDIGDLTTLIDNLFITFTPLCLPAEANCDGDPAKSIDIGDLTALIDNLFITFTPLPACQ